MQHSKASVRETYERIAASYATTRRRPWSEVLEFVESLPHRSSVLDVGCGHGRHARPLAHAGHQVTGVDFSRRLITIGRSESSSVGPAGIRWVVGEATALPFRDSSFDSAMCVAVLHHLPSPADRIAAVREIRRVVRRGGSILLCVWARDNPYLREVLGARMEADVEIPWRLPDGSSAARFYHLFDEGELKELIIESGLHGERFFRGSGNHFAVVTNNG